MLNPCIINDSEMKISTDGLNDELHHRGDSFLFWCFFGVLSTYVIEGPLRYILVLAGQPNVIYVRDAVAVASILFVFFRSLIARNWIEPGITIVSCLLLFHLVIGLFFGLPLFQALFGFKIFVSLLFGVAVYPLVRQRFTYLLIILACFYLITVTGVFFNYSLQKFPWEGVNYETAFGTVSGTKEWWTNGGIRRLPGLARSSFDAAMISGISGFACLILFKNLWYRILITLITLTAIFLTTTKGMIQAFLVITLWMLFKNSPFFLPLGRLFVVALLAVAVMLPSVVVFFDIGHVFSANELPSLLSSLWDRFSWMWPKAFDLLSGPENYLFGGGLGSIGTPQSYGLDDRQLNAADNIFVYVFVIFGPLSLFYLAYPAWRLLRSSEHGDVATWSIGILIICYGYGVTTNMLEQPFFSALLGMVLGHVLTEEPSMKSVRRR